MATRAVLSVFLLLSACAMPTRLQRIGVDHNTAAAGIADELTLLNILRAREDFPLHYTQVNRLTGTFTLRGTAGINDAIREAATTDTTAVGTTVSANPTSTVTTVTRQIAEGVDAITPNLGAEVSVTPSMDVVVLDNQKFYQGITAAIPFSTVQNILSQTPEQKLLLMMMLIERIDFRDATDPAKRGPVLHSWLNESANDASGFLERISCYDLAAQTDSRAAIRLAPVSRLPRGPNGELTGMRLEDLARLDGTNLELSDPIGTSPAGDDGVYVQRPRPDRGGANLSRNRACPIQDLSTPPPEQVFYNSNGLRVMVLGADGHSAREVAAQPEITFRSTEGVIRYVGRYLRAYEESPSSVPRIDGAPLFSVTRGRPGDSIVTATILGQRYSIVNDANHRRNMQVIALIEQLVNLHKESTDRPVTVPVRVLGGG